MKNIEYGYMLVCRNGIHGLNSYLWKCTGIGLMELNPDPMWHYLSLPV